MVEKIQGLPGNIVGIKVIGKLEDSDYETAIIPEIENTLKSHDKVRLLYIIGEEYDGIDPIAVWDDAKLGLKELTNWEKIAVVTNTEWIKDSVKVFQNLFTADVKVFKTNETSIAAEWIMA